MSSSNNKPSPPAAGGESGGGGEQKSSSTCSSDRRPSIRLTLNTGNTKKGNDDDAAAAAAATPPSTVAAAAAASAQATSSTSNNSAVAAPAASTDTTSTTAASATSTSNSSTNNRPSPPEAKRPRTETAAPPQPSVFFDVATRSSTAAARQNSSDNNNKTMTFSSTTAAAAGNIHSTALPDAASMDATASASNLTLLHQVTHLSWVFTRNNNNNDYCGQWHAEGTTSLYLIDNSASTAAASAAAAANKAKVAAAGSSSSSSPQAAALQQQQLQARAAAAAATATAAAQAASTTLALHLRGSCQVMEVQVEALNKRAVLTPLSNTTFLHADPLQHVLLKPPSSYTFSDFMPNSSNNIANKSEGVSSKDDDDDANTRPYRFDADAQSNRGAMGMTKGLRAASIASLKGELFVCCPRAEVLAGANVKSSTTTSSTTSSSGTTATAASSSSPAQEAAMTAWQKALTVSSSIKSTTATSPRKTSLNNSASTTTTTTTPASSPSSAAAAATAKAAAIAEAAKMGTGMQELQTRLYERSAVRRPKRIQLISRKLAAASASPTRNTAFRVTVRYRIPLPAASSTRNTTISRHHLGGLHVLTGTDDDLHGLQHSQSVGGSSNGSSSANNTMTTTTTPHVYTTTGVLGDHEGTRSWLPCLDAGAANFRASHEVYMKLTAPSREGLSILGMGEDAGVWESYLHETISNNKQSSSSTLSPEASQLVQQHLAVNNTTTTTTGTSDIQEETTLVLGADHVALVHRVCNHDIETQKTVPNANEQRQEPNQEQPQPHVIPPDQNLQTSTTLSLNDIQATCLWCSASWTPIPARSLGFAIGPFKVLEDPEYFGPSGPAAAAAAAAAQAEQDDKDDDDSDMEEKAASQERHYMAFCQAARRNGEGIRQVYFAPLMERKFLHLATNTSHITTGTHTNRRLLPNTRILLHPLSANQKKTIQALDQTVTFASVGVVHRALSLMRDVLALPTFRTASYTQIWIPHAVDGGTTSGALRSCPECLVNPFLGGAICDARLLPPVSSRLPFHQGGRVLQFLQARNAVRGWILAALPLGGNDDVGNGYIHALVESFIMSLYERGHGAQGEGGARGGVFFSRRYSGASGLNSTNLDFLPVQNIEQMDIVAGGLIGAVPVEDRQSDQLWRSATNGSESHTSAMDEFRTRHLLCKDVLEALERGNDRDKQVPTPSMGWHGTGFLFGSHLSLTFLSSNASSSSDLGCGALELFHPVGGLVYRTLKTEIFRGIVEGRAGVSNFLRLMRASFVAAHLGDQGETELVLPQRRDKKSGKDDQHREGPSLSEKQEGLPKPPFVVCVNEILAKKGLTHTLFTRALQNICGKLRESLLLGTLVDVERNAEDPRTRRPFVEPEGFPNSYVRGASLLYCRVGVQVEQSRETNSVGTFQCQIYAEPIIPEGGIAFGGPVTIRVVENEGQVREDYGKKLSVDGSRRDWSSAMVLHAKPVTTPKAQANASGTVESTESPKSAKSPSSKQGAIGGHGGGGVFADSHFHSAGYQAIELIRLTNLTPLLWVRVDPYDLYGGRISVMQPDACLAEQLFHDGDAAAQVDAIRALAERPLRIQGSVKVTTVYDVNISELPVRVLGDCLRGSPALHSSLPHTPAVRRLAALAIAQWQNNKAPQSSNAVGSDSWVGIDLLIQYFRERFYSSSVVMPMKFTRLAVRKSEAETRATSVANEGGAGNPKPSHDDSFQYLDALDEGEERAAALEDADDVETEEDEEYRVRAAAVTAVASIRAKDGQTPSAAIRFLEAVLEAEDDHMMSNVVFPDDDMMLEKTFRKLKSGGDDKASADSDDSDDDEIPTPSLSYISSQLVADTLLALCHVNASPSVYTDPATLKPIHSTGRHPVAKLMELAKGWLEWEMYRETIRAGVNLETRTGIAGNCHDVIAACAIVSLASLAILRQSTTNSTPEEENKANKPCDPLDEVATAKYYMDIFDFKPQRNDHTRAAAAQAIACICCAADRFEVESVPALGLLTALEFLLDRILDEEASPSLRQSLATIMMDACTGKVCSMQRVGAIAGRNDLITSAARFLCGPLLASHGGDCGSAMLMSVSPTSFPAASSVNDGARRGLRLLSRAGHPRDFWGRPIVVRVARFATRLWRVINGEPADPLSIPTGLSQSEPPPVVTGVCSYDGALRCSLLSLWMILWPKGCFAVLQVQAWKTMEGTKEYKDMGAHLVMKITEAEMQAAKQEDASLNDLSGLINAEIDRQEWRGEMAQKAYALFKAGQGSNSTNSASMVDVAQAEQGLGQPLPPIQRDVAFKQGGWIASAAQQRRAKALDGGTAVTKLRLKVGGNK